MGQIEDGVKLYEIKMPIYLLFNGDFADGLVSNITLNGDEKFIFHVTDLSLPQMRRH